MIPNHSDLPAVPGVCMHSSAFPDPLRASSGQVHAIARPKMSFQQYQILSRAPQCHCYENELQWPNSFSPALSRKPGRGPWTPACAGATVERRPHFHRLARPSQGHSHCYENELQWSNSFSPALSRKPGPGPWTPACAGATVERRPHFHRLARPSQGHSHSSKSELQWPIPSSWPWAGGHSRTPGLRPAPERRWKAERQTRRPRPRSGIQVWGYGLPRMATHLLPHIPQGAHRQRPWMAHMGTYVFGDIAACGSIQAPAPGLRPPPERRWKGGCLFIPLCGIRKAIVIRMNHCHVEP